MGGFSQLLVEAGHVVLLADRVIAPMVVGSIAGHEFGSLEGLPLNLQD